MPVFISGSLLPLLRAGEHEDQEFDKEFQNELHPPESYNREVQATSRERASPHGAVKEHLLMTLLPGNRFVWATGRDDHSHRRSRPVSVIDRCDWPAGDWV